MERTKKSTEMRISEIEAKKAQYQAKIENYSSKMADLDTKIQELRDVQKQKDLESLLEIIKSSGKTPEEIIAALK